MRLKPAIARDITLRPITEIMRATVDLDRQSDRGAVEIEDIPPRRDLMADLRSKRATAEVLHRITSGSDISRRRVRARL